MARFQFTMTALLCSIALVATGLAAMLDRSESRWLEPVFLTAVLALFVFAAMSAIFRRGPAQAFWGGFVIVAISYLALVNWWMVQGEQYGRGALATSRVLKVIEQYVQQPSSTNGTTGPAYSYPVASPYGAPAPVYAPPLTPPALPPVAAYPSAESASSPPGTVPADVSEPANAVQAPSPLPSAAAPPPSSDPFAASTAAPYAPTPAPAAPAASGYYAPAPTLIYTAVAVVTPTIDHDAFMRCGQVLWALVIGGAAGLLARRFYRARHCETPA
ncbi:MAG: hypothetical protein HYX69_10775 [Planctomycetia bacterium]|nr:hypothetical protein [Planctomycetia bacterium]